jgi:hypothetical protein
MSPATKKRIKAAIERADAALWLTVRRWAFRQLRKMVDAADDRLQAAQVKLRTEIAEREASSQQGSPVAVSKTLTPLKPAAGEDFMQWEARRSGVALVTKKSARRRHRLTAAEFDRQFA